MSRRFSEEQTIRFVKLYRELEPLWNLSHPDYKKRSIRLACVEKIIQEMNLSDFSEKDVMIKIRCLRSTYSQEVNKIQKSMIENESGHIYQPLLKWFPDMDYVMRNCGTSRLKAAITNFEFSENDLEYFKEEIVVTPVEIEILQQQNEALENQNKELCTRKKSSGNQSQNYTPPLRFSEDQTIRFVKLYKDYEQLWNINHPDYKNKSVRIACLEKIIDEMNLSNFGPRDAAMKIKNLRSTYTQELIKIQKSLTEDGSDNNIYQPLLKWFPDMDYVMSKCGNSKAKSLMDLDYPDFYMREEVIETTDLEPYQQLQVQPEVLLNSEENTRKFRRQQKKVVPKSPTKTSSTNDQYHNFAISKVSEAVRELTSLTRTLRTQAIQNEKVEDECDIVGRHVALQLRELPPAVRLTAQLDIQKVLCNCRLNLLEINHSDPDSQV